MVLDSLDRLQLSAQTINTPHQPTLSIHSLNTSTQPTLNSRHQPTLSTLITSSYQLTPSTSPLVQRRHRHDLRGSFGNLPLQPMEKFPRQVMTHPINTPSPHVIYTHTLHIPSRHPLLIHPPNTNSLYTRLHNDPSQHSPNTPTYYPSGNMIPRVIHRPPILRIRRRNGPGKLLERKFVKVCGRNFIISLYEIYTEGNHTHTLTPLQPIIHTLSAPIHQFIPHSLITTSHHILPHTPSSHPLITSSHHILPRIL